MTVVLVWINILLSSIFIDLPFTYGQDQKSGVLLSVGEQGLFFKTMEGTLGIKNEIIDGYPVLRFSIEPEEKDLFAKIKRLMLTHRRVTLSYKKRAYFWEMLHGETTNFVVGAWLEAP